MEDDAAWQALSVRPYCSDIFVESFHRVVKPANYEILQEVEELERKQLASERRLERDGEDGDTLPGLPIWAARMFPVSIGRMSWPGTKGMTSADGGVWPLVPTGARAKARCLLIKAKASLSFSLTGARAKARSCLLMHAEASLSLSVSLSLSLSLYLATHCLSRSNWLVV